MIKLLEEIDEMLAAMECVAHGMEGRAITEMRGRIQTELSNSHKPVVMQAKGRHCQQCDGIGRVVDDDFTGESIPCETCGGATVASEGRGEANTCAGCGTENAFNGVWIEGAERCYYCGDGRG